jgi:hypothetical protein
MKVPIRFDRTFHKSIHMKPEDEEAKNPVCPHGATVLLFLLTVQSCAHLTSSELAAIIYNKHSPDPPKRDHLRNVTMFREVQTSSHRLPNLATLLSHNLSYIIHDARPTDDEGLTSTVVR